MKKLIAFLMSLVLVFALAACSNQQGDPNTSSQNGSQTDESTPAPENKSGKNLVVYFSMPDNVDDSTVVLRCLQSRCQTIILPTSVHWTFPI